MLQRLFFLVFAFFTASSALRAEDTLPPPPPKLLYDITLKTIGNIPFPLNAFKGRVLLLVNIVTKGPNAEQIGELQTLYDSLADEGFTIIAFPSNDFTYFSEMTPESIKEVCKKTYGVQFPITSLTHVTGPDKSPIYQFLTNTETNPIYGLEVTWNFVKFLVDRQGNVVDRFNTVTKPSDERIKQAIMRQLKREKVS